jgi:hypothetical protein
MYRGSGCCCCAIARNCSSCRLHSTWMQGCNELLPSPFCLSQNKQQTAPRSPVVLVLYTRTRMSAAAASACAMPMPEPSTAPACTCWVVRSSLYRATSQGNVRGWIKASNLGMCTTRRSTAAAVQAHRDQNVTRRPKTHPSASKPQRARASHHHHTYSYRHTH